ncbi:hypothetical protein N4G70_29020 [Streptomyces sp. ASQP_92]|uniref:hypothetical protein n=1 Tax=Streptomyces sp. ASQP_92 TaxID=2979116 RepID=UPI0021C11317|nr:hypothetical protein [Streptomyces sp. ASQP_92]MCT9092883.1 hypothetical protein [Streptomyces sp. ASQP_92]
MAAKSAIAAPVFLMLARSRELVAAATAVGAGWALFGSFRGAGVMVGAALAATVVAAVGLGWLAVAGWVSPMPRGRRPLEDACSEAADRVADWAGWDGSPNAEAFGVSDETDREAA